MSVFFLSFIMTMHHKGPPGGTKENPTNSPFLSRRSVTPIDNKGSRHKAVMLALLHLATAGLTLRDAEAAGNAGDFGPLVELIRTEPGYQERAAFALGELARSGDARDGIVMAGALEPLVKLLKTGSDGKKENAALAIWLLANNHAGNQEKIGELGAIAPLVEMVRNGDAPSQQKASGALKSSPRSCRTSAGSSRLAVSALSGSWRAPAASPHGTRWRS